MTSSTAPAETAWDPPSGAPRAVRVAAELPEWPLIAGIASGSVAAADPAGAPRH